MAKLLQLEKFVYSPWVSISSRSAVKVKVGERVKESQVVATETKYRVKKINLASKLQVKGKKVLSFLEKELGDLVSKGELLARRKNLWGKREVFAPISGRLDSVTEKGFLKIKKQITKEILSPFSAKVSKVKKRKISFAIPGWQIKGSWGMGKAVKGPLKLVLSGKGKEELLKLECQDQGKIVFLKGELSRAWWFKALSVGVAGVICRQLSKDGLRKRLLEEEKKSQQENQEWTFPSLVILDGKEIEDKTWEFLKKKVGCEAFLEGSESSLVVTQN
ncbi:hypothetical protein ACFLZP_03135 [Patescibacteria group bacterium]